MNLKCGTIELVSVCLSEAIRTGFTFWFEQGATCKHVNNTNKKKKYFNETEVVTLCWESLMKEKLIVWRIHQWAFLWDRGVSSSAPPQPSEHNLVSA